METFSDRRHHVELAVLLVEPERVRHVVRVQTENPEPGEQRAAAARRHDPEHRRVQPEQHREHRHTHRGEEQHRERRKHMGVRRGNESDWKQHINNTKVPL